MRLPFFRPKRSQAASGEGLESIRSLFSKFQRIQKLNTKSLELMAEMEQALGGEYIFDRAFLESSVRSLSSLAYQVVYSLNAMSQNRYVELFDRFQSIKSTLEDVLGGGFGPFAESLTLPYSALGWEMEPLVGALNVYLAEARLRLDLPAPDGFAVTATGCRLFMKANGIDEALQSPEPKELQEALAGAALPLELEQAIRNELQGLLTGRTGLIRLAVRVCASGDSGGIQPDLGGSTEIPPEDILPACRSVLVEYVAKAASSRPFEQAPFALAVHEAVPAYVVGSITSQVSKGFPAGLFSITAAPVDAPERAERYLLRRIHPFDLVQWDVSSPSLDQPLIPVTKALSQAPRGLYRGSSLLDATFLKAIAESAITIERMLGCVQEVHWARGDADRPIFLDIRPSRASDDGDGSSACDSGDEPESAEVLLSRGETVQAGISAGCAVHVSEGYDLEAFPHGAIAVARVASPWLSPLLRRASAIVTELGTSISHLATVAREMRVPAIFGALDALERIPEGAEITVDAGERTVYRGVVESLLACRECSTGLYPSDPEYVALRRLLRWIMPLGLIDPESDDFTSDNCRTYHDIIHFAHERSVEELLHIQDRGRGLADLHAGKLELGVPVDLFVIDLGGGIAAGSTGSQIELKDVVSEPFQAFIRGLTFKEMWSCGPGSIKLRDIFAGLDRTFAAITNPPEYGGMNHAIVAENYMNLGLRLGYHFSVVDTSLGSNVNQNYIYFRFVGGFADERKRRLRAELIRIVLEEMRFKVMVKGDLVVGKLKIAAREEVTAALIVLGELTGFTKQLDLAMSSEEKVGELAELFRKKSICGNASDNEEERADA